MTKNQRLLKDDILSTCDERYVRINDCNDTQAENTRKFAEDDKKLAIFAHDMTIIKWLGAVIAGGTIAQLIAQIFEML